MSSALLRRGRKRKADRFFTGGFFRGASGRGKDIDYGYLMLQFDISRSKPKIKPVKG